MNNNPNNSVVVTTDGYIYPKPLTIYRENLLQQMLKKYRGVYRMTRTLMQIAGSPFDIRPGKSRKNKIVERLAGFYELPNIIVPCVVKRDAWTIDKLRQALAADCELPQVVVLRRGDIGYIHPPMLG